MLKTGGFPNSALNFKHLLTQSVHLSEVQPQRSSEQILHTADFTHRCQRAQLKALIALRSTVRPLAIIR